MARIRSLKPEMWSSESVGRLSREARLLLVELITQVDDEGRIRASSRGLASLLYPFDDDAPGKIDGWLSELQAEGMFVRYIVDGATYGYLPKFNKHQKIDHPSKSKIPAPDDALANPRESSRILAPDQGSRIKDQDQDLGSEQHAPRSAAPVVADLVGPAFSVTGGATVRIDRDFYDTLTAAYPTADIDGELAKAAAWCAAATKKKTAAGIKRFLNAWLNRNHKASTPEPVSDRPTILPMTDEQRAYALEVERLAKAGLL